MSKIRLGIKLFHYNENTSILFSIILQEVGINKFSYDRNLKYQISSKIILLFNIHYVWDG